MLVLTFILIAFILNIGYQINKRNLVFKYVLLWFTFSIGILSRILFPDFLDKLVKQIGFEFPANGLLVIALTLLSFISYQVTLDLSKMQKKIDILVIKSAKE